MADATGKALTKQSEEIALAYRAILDGEKIPQTADPEVVSRMILERIIAAETFEEAFRPQELGGWQEYLDEPVVVQGFHLNSSTFEQGSSIYAVADIVLTKTGEQVTVTCGGRNVVTQLVKMLEKGWLRDPEKAVKLTAKDTAEGFRALWLEAAA